MSASAVQRLTKEYRDLMRISSDYWTVRPRDGNLRVWSGNIHGLDDPRHLGKNYSLEITFSENHPFRPPSIRFLDKVNCENVYPCGKVCLDILGNQWSPAFTVDKLMFSLCSVLTDKPMTNLKAKPYKYSMNNTIPRNEMINVIQPIRRRRRTELEMLSV